MATNQKVGGSSPSQRARKERYASAYLSFLFGAVCEGRETSSNPLRPKGAEGLGERSSGPFVKREESPEMKGKSKHRRTGRGKRYASAYLSFLFGAVCEGRETSSKKRERSERRLGERSGGPFVKREESPSRIIAVCEGRETSSNPLRPKGAEGLGERSSGPFVKREESPEMKGKSKHRRTGRGKRYASAYLSFLFGAVCEGLEL